MLLRVPISPVQLWAFWTLSLVFFLFLLRAFSRRTSEAGTKRNQRSRFGILLQAIGIAIAGLGRPKPTLPPLGLPGLVGTTVVVLLMIGAIALFAASSSALGRNWSIVARTRADHELVRSGPYAKGPPPYLSWLASLPARACRGAWALASARPRSAALSRRHSGSDADRRSPARTGVWRQIFGVSQVDAGAAASTVLAVRRRRRLPCLWLHRPAPAPCGPRRPPCRCEPRQRRPSTAGRTSYRAGFPRGSSAAPALRSCARSP